MGTTSQGFAIVGLYGYEAGLKRGSLLGLYAEHDDVGETYERAVRYVEQLGNEAAAVTLPWAPPAMVLTDGAGEVLRGVRLAWKAGMGPGFGPGTGKPYAKRCEWHLRKNAKQALAKHLISGPKHPLRRRLDTAFLPDEGWDEFATRAGTFPHAARWVKANNKHVTDQVGRRAQLPQHHSLAALETVITDVRQKVERRAFTFRNQRRMNLLLVLMRLHRLRVDDLDHYTSVLRASALAAGGRIEYQRQGYCVGRNYDLRP